MTINFPQALFFDFDGVLVDSNRIKVQAFYELFKDYDSKVADKLVKYHKQHGGISRVVKIQYAFDTIIKQPLTDEQLYDMAETYSRLVVQQVISARWIVGAKEFLNQAAGQLPIFLISGTPEEELIQIVEKRNMAHFFREILGSPIMKPKHIEKLLVQYQLNPKQCVFVGDAYTDLMAARECNMPFIGIQGDYTFPPDAVVLPDCSTLKHNISLLRDL